jgi:hypothetical protein
MGFAQIDQRAFSVEVSVKKRGSRRFSQKENADFLINVLGSAPIDQRVFFRGDQRKKGLR